MFGHRAHAKKFHAKRASCFLMGVLLLLLCCCGPRFPESPLTILGTDACIKSNGNPEAAIFEKYQNNEAPRTRVFSYGEYRVELSYVDSARRSFASYDMDQYTGEADGVHFEVKYRQNTDKVCGIDITPSVGTRGPISHLPQTEEAYLAYIQDILTEYGISTETYNKQTVTTRIETPSDFLGKDHDGFFEASAVEEDQTITEYSFLYMRSPNGIDTFDTLRFVFRVENGGIWIGLDIEPMLTDAVLASLNMENFTEDNIKNAIAHWTMEQYPDQKPWIRDVEIRGKALFVHDGSPALLVWAVRYDKKGIGRELEEFVLPINSALPHE